MIASITWGNHRQHLVISPKLMKSRHIHRDHRVISDRQNNRRLTRIKTQNKENIKQEPVNITHLSHVKKFTNYLLYDLLIFNFSLDSPSSPLEHSLVVIPMHCNSKEYGKIAKEVSKNFHDRRHSTSYQNVDIASPGRFNIYFGHFYFKFCCNFLNFDIFRYIIFYFLTQIKIN